eukprot:m.325701 g.325701  ORF g.325701 m.325701 type:complete len:106 (+) comp55564_c2_seq14:1499-1816(+)
MARSSDDSLIRVCFWLVSRAGRQSRLAPKARSSFSPPSNTLLLSAKVRHPRSILACSVDDQREDGHPDLLVNSSDVLTDGALSLFGAFGHVINPISEKSLHVLEE